MAYAGVLRIHDVRFTRISRYGCSSSRGYQGGDMSGICSHDGSESLSYYFSISYDMVSKCDFLSCDGYDGVRSYWASGVRCVVAFGRIGYFDEGVDCGVIPSANGVRSG